MHKIYIIQNFRPGLFENTYVYIECYTYKTQAIWNTYEVKLHNLINSTTEDNAYLTFRKPCN